MDFTFISLFAGIGGMDLGLERAGMRCVAQVEIDPYATQVLAKHWPHVARFRDVRTVGGHNLPSAHLICGGFPCQDVSNAGRRAGIHGKQSSLWFEYARIIGDLRPKYVLVENVAALLRRGFDRVLGDLAALGYDAEWHCIPAAAVGAPHRRDRLFLLAYTNGRRAYPQPQQASQCADALHADRHGALQQVADTNGQGLEKWESITSNLRQELTTFKRSCSTGSGNWAVEPNVGRMAHGVPHRLDRLRGLGNAVVPQIAELLGYQILAHAARLQQQCAD